MIKAIIFDMDGVLIEAKEWHYEALNRALELFGYTINRHEHLTTFDGLPTSTKLEMLSATSGLPKELHKFINEMKQVYTMEMVHSLCKPTFHHEYALSRLKSDGYKLGVASNSIKDTVRVMMEKSNLASYLDIQLSAENVTKGKPSPEIYNLAIKLLGCKPNECLIVEDNEKGIRAAKASGAHVLVVKEVSDTNYSNIIKMIKSVNIQDEINSCSSEQSEDKHLLETLGAE